VLARCAWIIVVLFIMILTTINSGCIEQNDKTINISGAFALYPMMGVWAEEYQKIHPDIRIDLSAGGAGKGMSDAIIGIVDIGMVSREIYQEEINQGIFWVSVAIDAVVITINSNNPALSKILERGVTQEEFIQIFITRKITTWQQLCNTSSNLGLIRVYTRSDSCGAAQTLASFLGDYSQDDLTNVADSAINGDPNLAAAIQNDKLGIGYNNINFVYNHDTRQPYEGIYPIPIDLNGNHILDETEQFYDSIDTIVEAISAHRYPSPPARALHLVTKNNFSGITKEFINWILTDGQEFVEESGYIRLPSDIITEQLQILEEGNRS
jgi:phosphate transport system substrate-binding protein